MKKILISFLIFFLLEGFFTALKAQDIEQILIKKFKPLPTKETLEIQNKLNQILIKKFKPLPLKFRACVISIKNDLLKKENLDLVLNKKLKFNYFVPKLTTAEKLKINYFYPKFELSEKLKINYIF